MNQEQHTPTPEWMDLPWHATESCNLADKNGKIVFNQYKYFRNSKGGEGPRNPKDLKQIAERTAKAVNCHEELLAALEFATEQLNVFSDESVSNHKTIIEALRQSQAAIAKAKGLS